MSVIWIYCYADSPLVGNLFDHFQNERFSADIVVAKNAIPSTFVEVDPFAVEYWFTAVGAFIDYCFILSTLTFLSFKIVKKVFCEPNYKIFIVIAA